MNFFKNLEDILFNANIEERFLKFEKFYCDFLSNKLELSQQNFTPLELKYPSYSKFCKIVNMKDIKNNIKDRQIHFLHNIAHIEYSAIDIALDACYRFTNMPKKFYQDWLEVAKEEISHFLLIDEQLQKYGIKYGDLPVHDGLFKAMQSTSNNLLDRMIIIPRFMEANGLDANCFILSKLTDNSLKSILETILKEEVGHVKKGDYWFKFLTPNMNNKERENLYFSRILYFYPNSFKQKRKINEKDRLNAGFSQSEIDRIKNFYGV